MLGLLPRPLACCRQQLEQHRMTPLSNLILRIIVDEDPKLVCTLNAHYADEAAGGTPTEIASRLGIGRASVYRVVGASGRDERQEAE